MNNTETITELRVDFARLEGRVDAMERILGNVCEVVAKAGNHGPLPRMTTKQHAALQMLLRGASNAEIAERFGVTINTAKVYVRSLFSKFGVNNRASVVAKAKMAFEAMPASEYIRWSGGLPKTWDRDWSAPDAYKALYHHSLNADDGECEDGT